MKTVQYKCGYEGTYDETLIVGDIITTYYKGYWKLVSIIKVEDEEVLNGGDPVPLFEFLQIADATGKPKNPKKTKTCDAAYCRRATESIDKEIKNFRDKASALAKFRKSLC